MVKQKKSREFRHTMEADMLPTIQQHSSSLDRTLYLRLQIGVPKGLVDMYCDNRAVMKSDAISSKFNKQM